MTETIGELVRHFLDAISAGDLRDELLAPDMSMWSSVSGTTSAKPVVQRAMKALASIARGGIHYAIVTLTVEGERAVAEIRSSGTLINDAEFENWHIMIFELRDGRIASVKEYVNPDVVREKIHPLLFQAMASQQ